jgi:hypothetical protein
MAAASRMSLGAIGLAIVALAVGALAGCSASLPGPGSEMLAGSPIQTGPQPSVGQTASKPSQSATTGTAAGASGSAVGTPAAAGKRFRSATVVLFTSESGQQGVRVPVSTLPSPLTLGRRSSDGSRLEVQTVQGMLWLPASELVGESGSPHRNNKTWAQGSGASR